MSSVSSEPPIADLPTEGLRRRSAPSSTKPNPSDVVEPLPPSPALVPSDQPIRPTLSRTSTDSNGTSSSSSRFEISEEDPFSAFSLLDFINVVDAHLDLWTRPLRRKSVSWKSKADKLLDDAKQKGREFKLPAPFNDFPVVGGISRGGSGSGGTTTPAFTKGEFAGLSQKERERLERKYKEVRRE